MYSMLTKYRLVWLTITLISIIFFVLGHHSVFLDTPNGIHVIRQTDSLSFVSQYYNNGFHFFQPANFNLASLEGRAACEFPLYYYVISCLYLIFGITPALLKIAHVITVYIGVVYFVRLAKIELNHLVLALFSGLFFFTSTVFNDYSFNYLPDAEALGLTLIGIYHYRQYQKKRINRNLHFGTILFLLAGLVKVTYLIYPIAFAVYELAATFLLKKEKDSKVSVGMLVHVGITLVLVAMWNLYMLHYNELYHSDYYLTQIKPIWALTGEQIHGVWDAMIYVWNSAYMSHPSMFVLVLLILVQFIFYRRGNKELLLLNSILLLGNLCYFLLFFRQFQEHDYYMLVMFPMIALYVINGLITLQSMKVWKRKYVKEGVMMFLILILVYGVRYSGLQLDDRRNLEENRLAEMGFAVRDNRSLILSFTSDPNATFIVAPDPAPNASLFYLNRMGWTIKDEDKITENWIHRLQQKGADYIILPENYNTTKLFNAPKVLMNKNGIQLIELKNSK